MTDDAHESQAAMEESLTTSNTIGELIAMNYGVHLDCRCCGHHSFADLEDLRMKFGQDFPMSRAILRMVCSQCGKRDVAMMIHYDRAKSMRGR